MNTDQDLDIDPESYRLMKEEDELIRKNAEDDLKR
jgi:hypothetical protein